TFHLQAVRRLLETCSVFIFTFGLTECWVHRATQTVFPTAPGVFAGDYDPEHYAFHNLSFAEVVQDFLRFRAFLQSFNPACRFIVTVSPVPLTATASGHHVLVATAHSKAILRAAAGELVAQCPDVDYFPSYEIITNTAARGSFYENNLRDIRRVGVESAMAAFFAQHGQAVGDLSSGPAVEAADGDHDPACEDAFLEAFAGKAGP
ncbi:MAG: GSCFA domain-containing protein, partial [Rhodospirillaceae bacterium]|nr:GSCFA domain-containing protein [Rhodospirillaceae bacterium]